MAYKSAGVALWDRWSYMRPKCGSYRSNALFDSLRDEVALYRGFELPEQVPLYER